MEADQIIENNEEPFFIPSVKHVGNGIYRASMKHPSTPEAAALLSQVVGEFIADSRLSPVPDNGAPNTFRLGTWAAGYKEVTSPEMQCIYLEVDLMVRCKEAAIQAQD